MDLNLVYCTSQQLNDILFPTNKNHFSFHTVVQEYSNKKIPSVNSSWPELSNTLNNELKKVPNRLTKNTLDLKHKFQSSASSKLGVITAWVHSFNSIYPFLEPGASFCGFLKISSLELGFNTLLEVKESPYINQDTKAAYVEYTDNIPCWARPEPGSNSRILNIEALIPEYCLNTLPQLYIYPDFSLELLPSLAYFEHFFNGTVIGPGFHKVLIRKIDGTFGEINISGNCFPSNWPSFILKIHTSIEIFHPDSTAEHFSTSWIKDWFGIPGLQIMDFLKSSLESPSLGVLAGRPGSGKSWLLHRLSVESGLKIQTVNATKFLKSNFGTDLEIGVKVLVLDHMHELFGRNGSEFVLEGIFKIMAKFRVTILCLTSKKYKLSPQFLDRCCFFAELTTHTNFQRQSILKNRLGLAQDLIERISEECPGYLLADLFTLAKGILACNNSLHLVQRAKKFIQLTDINSRVPFLQKIPSIYFNEIGGLSSAKTALKRLTSGWGSRQKSILTAFGVVSSKGALLYGPPGTGKTLLAKALATEASANFLPVRIPDLIHGEIGASEKALARLFELAKESSPCIMFLDELDALFGNRASSSAHSARLVSQFVLNIDNIAKEQQVFILAATNHPLSIDPIVLRPGRIDHHIYLSPPDPGERLEILRLLLSEFPAGFENFISDLAGKTEGFTGADLTALIHRAQVLAHKDQLEPRHLYRVLSIDSPCPLIPSVLPHQLLEFEAFHSL